MTPSTLTLAALFAVTAPAQGHDCPMAPSHDHRAAVDRRHDDATGVGHEASRHQFRLARDGGSIQLEVTNANDAEGRDRIRTHLRAITAAFAAGDFALPRRIHDQLPPGAEAMAARSRPPVS